MSVRSMLAEPAAAIVSVQPVAASVQTMSAGRIGAIVGGLLGLTAVVLGGMALARSSGRIGTGSGTGTGFGRRGAVAALVAGPIGMAIGALVAATADAGIGTGNGRGGAYVALVVGLIGTVLGGSALARYRRTG
ncbi:DUF6223 family protein [Streptomyces sp. NBC_01351]|uniref:DUF6223 family protein n=1 Tax=Streptomyces sp. NBC_01351 TaxID=2903833 RepID=UPI002E2EAD5A|nr:DUF6223 family protein [Streptomyces sp. NBC_01351]